VIDAERDFATMQDFIVGRLSDDEQRAFEDRLLRESALAH
jgi:anti-sigma-K factor RskA